MHDFVEHVKQRSQEIYIAILDSISNSQSISVEEIAKMWGKPLNLIIQRLEILAAFGVIKINGDKVSKGSLAPTDITLPLNAKDLELTPREKLVIRALNNLHVANVDTILEWLKTNGDNIRNRLTVYKALKKLVSLGVVEEIRKNNPMFKLKGKKCYYKPKVWVEVTESTDQLLKQWQEYYGRGLRQYQDSIRKAYTVSHELYAVSSYYTHTKQTTTKR